MHQRAGEVKERVRTLREKREERRAAIERSDREKEKERERKREEVTEEKRPIELAEFYPKFGASSSFLSPSHPPPLSPFRHHQPFIIYLSLVLSTSQLLYLHSFVHLVFFHLLSRSIVYLLPSPVAIL